MNTTIKLLTLAALIAGGSSQMRAQTMKEKLAAKKAALEAKMSKAGSKYKTYDYEDPTGLSGTYFINTQLVGKNNTIGLKFEKEKDGNIVNELLVSYGKESSTYDADEFESTARLDEKIQKEFDFKVFKVIKSDIFEWRSKDVSFCELTEHVFAVVLEGSVISVAAKDSSLFADYDIETAQVLIDQKMVN